MLNIVIIVVKMSDSPLSDVPTDLDGYDAHYEPSLTPIFTPFQQLVLIPVRLQPPGQMLPPTQSPLFTKELYSRVLLETNPLTIKVGCMQPGCGYSPTAQTHAQAAASTGNLWKHYSLKHRVIYDALKQKKTAPSSQSSSASSFFEPRRPVTYEPRLTTNPAKYRELVLSFIVSNNLSLRIIESYSYCQLIQFLSPSVLSLSLRTLHRELQR